jgi:pyruvate/2-oxoglutarate dehydrogenase complex dihydrolipoamide acyltransferase (E2) component
VPEEATRPPGARIHGRLHLYLTHAETAEIQQAISAPRPQGACGKLTIEDLSGGTFTITNGGVYRSLMSTPILNPQSAILGNKSNSMKFLIWSSLFFKKSVHVM